MFRVKISSFPSQYWEKFPINLWKRSLTNYEVRWNLLKLYWILQTNCLTHCAASWCLSYRLWHFPRPAWNLLWTPLPPLKASFVPTILKITWVSPETPKILLVSLPPLDLPHQTSSWNDSSIFLKAFLVPSLILLLLLFHPSKYPWNLSSNFLVLSNFSNKPLERWFHFT